MGVFNVPLIKWSAEMNEVRQYIAFSEEISYTHASFYKTYVPI